MPSYSASESVYKDASLIWDVGDLRQKAMYFEPTVHYQLNSSPADSQWAAMVPPNGGSVRVGPDRQQYLVSMFHQLRCLDIMRRSYNAREGLSPEGPSAVTQHCLHYLRQMVLCRSDTRLEPVIDIEGPHAVRAWGPMTCDDWTQVYDAHARNVREYEEQGVLDVSEKALNMKTELLVHRLIGQRRCCICCWFSVCRRVVYVHRRYYLVHAAELIHRHQAKYELLFES